MVILHVITGLVPVISLLESVALFRIGMAGTRPAMTRGGWRDGRASRCGRMADLCRWQRAPAAGLRRDRGWREWRAGSMVVGWDGRAGRRLAHAPHPPRHGRACPGHPDPKSAAFHVIGITRTRPAMTWEVAMAGGRCHDLRTWPNGRWERPLSWDRKTKMAPVRRPFPFNDRGAYAAFVLILLSAIRLSFWSVDFS